MVMSTLRASFPVCVLGAVLFPGWGVAESTSSFDIIIPSTGLTEDVTKEVDLSTYREIKVIDESRKAQYLPKNAEGTELDLAYAFENGACNFTKTITFKDIFPGSTGPYWNKTNAEEKVEEEEEEGEESTTGPVTYTFSDPGHTEKVSFCVRFESKAAAASEGDDQAKSRAAADTEGGDEPESKPEADTEGGDEPQPKAEADTEGGDEPESKPEADTEGGDEPESKAEAHSEGGDEPQSRRSVEPKTVPEVPSVVEENDVHVTESFLPRVVKFDDISEDEVQEAENVAKAFDRFMEEEEEGGEEYHMAPSTRRLEDSDPKYVTIIVQSAASWLMSGMALSTSALVALTAAAVAYL